MRALTTALSFLVLSSLTAGCGFDTSSHISCSDAQGCANQLGMLRAGDASAYELPTCCNRVCVIAQPGCDSGYRYLAEDPGGMIDVAECVATIGCALSTGDLAAAVPDLAHTHLDLSTAD